MVAVQLAEVELEVFIEDSEYLVRIILWQNIETEGVNKDDEYQKGVYFSRDDLTICDRRLFFRRSKIPDAPTGIQSSYMGMYRPDIPTTERRRPLGYPHYRRNDSLKGRSYDFQ